MTFRLCSILLCLMGGVAGPAAAALPPDSLKRDESAPASSLRVSNNYPFPIREPVRFQLPADFATGTQNLLAVSHSVSGGTVEAHYLPIQIEPAQEGEGVTAWIDVQLRANESRVYTFQDVGGASSDRTPTSITESFPNGLPSTLTWNPDTQANLFNLSLLEIVEGVDSFSADRVNRIKRALADPLQATFKLEEESHGAVKSTLVYRATAEGGNRYGIEIRYDTFSSGITDIEIVLQTTKSRADHGYLALAKQMPSQAGDQTALQAEGMIRKPAESDSSSPEAAANWFSWGDFKFGQSQAILTGVTPNLTRKQGDHFLSANNPVVAEILLAADNEWILSAEISGENRIDNLPSIPFVLPGKKDIIHLRYRVLPSKSRSPEETNQAFISFAGYQGRHLEKEEFHVSFGAGGVSFGNTYAPHSTHGENWGSFKEEIRQDLRIANALGIDWIRLHGIDAPASEENYLTTQDGKWMLEYLEFMAKTAKESGLKIYLGFSLNPKDSGFIAKRFGDTIGFYEIGNNALAQGIPAERVEQWREVREEITTAQPGAPVVVTGGHGSLPLFKRLEHLEFEIDALGQQLLPDDQLAAGNFADQAVALGGYATRIGKMPFISTNLWQKSSRDSENAQATAFFRAGDALLSQQGVPMLLLADLTQPLRPDRTPTVQAHAYNELIRRYGAADNRIKMLDISMPLFSIRPGQTATLAVTIKNLANRPLEIRLNPRLPDGLTTDSNEETITLRPRESRSLKRIIEADSDLAPGFYHIFEEARFEDTVRFGWTYASHRAAPALNLAPPSDAVSYPRGLEQLGQINLSNLRHVVYGSDAPKPEVDAALQLQNSLRAATGAEIRRWTHDEIDEDRKNRSLLLVGNQETNPLIAQIADRLPVNPLDLAAGEGVVMVIEHPNNPNRFFLIISGKDAAGTAAAASDLIGRVGN